MWICVSWDTAEQHNGLKKDLEVHSYIFSYIWVLSLHERMKIEEVWGENMSVKTYDATSKAFLFF